MSKIDSVSYETEFLYKRAIRDKKLQLERIGIAANILKAKCDPLYNGSLLFIAAQQIFFHIKRGRPV